jgi:hypothetical protein
MKPGTGGRARVVAAVLGALLLAGAAAATRGCGRDATGGELKELEKAYYALRDAVLQGDDEAFFRMHSAEARAWALGEFPAVRATYVASGPEDRKAFERTFRVGAKEFLEAEPRAMVVKMMPWRSGWRENVEFFRSAKVRDLSFHYEKEPGGGTLRKGIVELEAGDSGARNPTGGGLAGGIQPTVVLVKDPDGWKRESFYLEARPVVTAPPRPGR